jgi:hypothetical protein
MTRLRPILIGALLLLSGGVMALVVEHTLIPTEPPAARPLHHDAVVAQLDSILRLTAAQRDSIQAVFTRHQVRINSAWHAINRNMAATMDTVHHELEGVLDSQQVAAFRSWSLQQHRLRARQH